MKSKIINTYMDLGNSCVEIMSERMSNRDSVNHGHSTGGKRDMANIEDEPDKVQYEGNH